MFCHRGARAVAGAQIMDIQKHLYHVSIPNIILDNFDNDSFPDLSLLIPSSLHTFFPLLLAFLPSSSICIPCTFPFLTLSPLALQFCTVIPQSFRLPLLSYPLSPPSFINPPRSTLIFFVPAGQPRPYFVNWWPNFAKSHKHAQTHALGCSTCSH